MLTKIVNGEKVTLTAEEEAAQIAEWDANKTTVTEERRLQAIKDESRSRIIAQIPGGTHHNYIEKENHMHGRHSKYLAMLQRGEVLTQAQADEMTMLESIFDVMDDIISMSNLAETNGDTVDVYITALDAKGY